MGLIAYSFFLRAGRVGTNLSFWAPCLVTSGGFFARLPMALGPADGTDDSPLSAMVEWRVVTASVTCLTEIF